MKKLTNKVGTLNIILIIVAVLFIVFNYQMIELYKEVGSIPETYATSIIASLLGECGICGIITRTKIKNNVSNNKESSDEDE